MGKQMTRCVVVGASPFCDAVFLKSYLLENDYIIAADGGSRLLDAMGIVPHAMIGDYDSSPCPLQNDIPCDILPTQKDDTDVFAAVKAALAKGYREFLLLGCLGGRLDHTVSNLFLLQFLSDHQACGMLVDEWHEVSLLAFGTHAIPPRKGYYLSLLPYGGCAKGITIKGALYTLDNADLDTAFPLGVSNEFLEEMVYVTVKQGCLLQILSKKDR